MEHPANEAPEERRTEDEREAEEVDGARAPTDPEVPEADAVEQQTDPHSRGDAPLEVNQVDAAEADLLEQAREVDGDDEDEHR